MTMINAITTLAEAEGMFRLTRTEAEDFFPEWCVDLPDLTNGEQERLEELRHRYMYQRSLSHLLENPVTLLFASPLLTLAGFYDPPFVVKAEESVTLTLADSEEILQGRLDVLVLKEQFWVVVIESQKTTLSIWSALPQTLLAYLMANPQHKKPSFALMTNSDNSVFVKLNQPQTSSEQGEYNFSRVFATLTSIQELQAVLQGLKRLGHLADASSPQ